MQLAPNFYDDLHNVQKVGKELKLREEKCEKLKEIENLISDCEVAIELLEIEPDEDTEKSLLSTLSTLEENITNFKIETSSSERGIKRILLFKHKSFLTTKFKLLLILLESSDTEILISNEFNTVLMLRIIIVSCNTLSDLNTLFLELKI